MPELITRPELHEGASVGEALVAWLEARGLTVVFGIPGVHTVEMYRGLGQSRLRHVTPRHEQGAGFMADGYARVTGKPGVAFVITGPGMTNILTAMGQALADSIPMLVISSVNATQTIGKGYGHLHEMPDQHVLAQQLSLRSHHVSNAHELYPALEAVFDDFGRLRPGPHHIQVPMDVFGALYEGPVQTCEQRNAPTPKDQELEEVCDLLKEAHRPLIVMGGGAVDAAEAIGDLAGRLSAPVVQTINARGALHNHPLRVPASPSLQTVRTLFDEADVVLALGTELGPTDFDMDVTGTMPELSRMIRVDIDPAQLARHPVQRTICGAVEQVLPVLNTHLTPPPEGEPDWGETRANMACKAARAELSPEYQHLLSMVETIRDTLPGSIIVGDSTQPIYAANLFYGHDTPRGWFNSSAGFGTLGYAIPAAIGAALGAPDQKVVCLIGDGGAQFTLPEMMTAVDENLPVTFIIWNNSAYQEIANAMQGAGVTVVGCHPKPPDFTVIAKGCGIASTSCENSTEALREALLTFAAQQGPSLIEIRA